MAEGLLDGDVRLVGFLKIRKVFAELIVNFNLFHIHQLHDSQRGGSDLGN